MNSMNLKNHKRMKYIREAILCILIGTIAGLGVYGFFLYFHIDIYGWNLGLIFAPLAAGYIETILANRIIGENIGAISAFFLFIYTTFYSFILKNPTLGFNIITIGSIAVILQAAFPTSVNYIIFSLGFGIITKTGENIKDNPVQDITDNFISYLGIISDGRVSSEFPEADKLNMNIYSDNKLIDYKKLSEGTK